MLGLRRLGLCVVLVWAGCDSTPAIDPPPDPDQARECSGAGMDAGVRSDGGGAGGGCAAGEICLQGRCYSRCSADADCGPSETCSSSGACIRGVRPDGGPTDGGTPGPCDGVMCDPLVCHPQTGLCGDCSEDTVSAAPGEPGRCPASGPICDIANGSCLPFAPAQCAPCNLDTDCVATDGSFNGTCVLRETLGVREQVCMGPCAGDGSCPSGLECRSVRNLTTDMDVMVCLPPPLGVPCTNWLAGVRDQTCFSDADCAPRGATLAVYPEVCEGEVISMEDGGVSTPGRCLQPCGETDDCIDAVAGEQCLGSGTILFCRIPPPP